MASSIVLTVTFGVVNSVFAETVSTYSVPETLNVAVLILVFAWILLP